MVSRIFLSSILPRGTVATECASALAHFGFSVLKSPIPGEDPRWLDWYRGGATREIGATDAFIGLDFDGYGSSVMMASEFGEAVRQKESRSDYTLWLIRPDGNEPLTRAFSSFDKWGKIVAAKQRQLSSVIEGIVQQWK